MNPELTNDAARPNSLQTPLDAGRIAGETDVPVGVAADEPTGTQNTATRKEASNATPHEESNTSRFAFLVGAGILLSRIIGLVRQRVFGHYLGLSIASGAFYAAFRIPNFLQNVFGEGALSASFIPVYSKLLARGDEQEAGRVAGAVFALLALVTSLLVLAGVLLTPYLIDLIAPGFEGETRQLTIHLVRIFFPGAGLLVLSAWCLGVLNSHRRFFLSYTAPVIWNISIISALVFYGNHVAEFPLATIAAWGSVIGSFLQFAVQLPVVLRLVSNLQLSFDIALESVRTVLRNFLPVFVSRGVVQISAFVDSMLASLLGEIPVAALGVTQSLYTLPVSLFGISISAAELPEMASERGNTEEVAARLRRRLDAGLQRIAFYIVPSSMAFLALGDVITAALYQTGKFKNADARYVWAVLAGSAIGLLASTLGRLYSSTYYALHDTRTPLGFAVIRVVLTTVLGYLFALPLPRLLGLDAQWGVAGLTASAGLAGWVEFALLRRTLNRRIGRTGVPLPYAIKLWSSAALSAGLAWGFKLLTGAHHPIITAAIVLGAYGFAYFASTYALKLPEAQTVIKRFTRLAKLTRK